MGEGCFELSIICILKSILHANQLLVSHYALHVLSSYVCDHAASLTISANADFVPHSSVQHQVRRQYSNFVPLCPSKLQCKSCYYSATSTYCISLCTIPMEC